MNRRAGFTLIEVLIVVVIMAILAATIIPQFSASTQDAQQSQTDFNVHTLRSQIELYKLQHGGKYPELKSNTIDQLVKKTKLDGTVDQTNGTLGPYVLEIPINQMTGSAKVTASTTGTEKTGGGWLYDAATGHLWQDKPGP